MIRQLIDRRLKTGPAAEVLLSNSDAHLDEDAINAFVEGRLEENEVSPIISHLVTCTFCRHATAQLIRFESQFNDQEDVIVDEAPGRVRLFLENLAARVTPSFEEDAVFAYHNPEGDHESGTETEEKNSEPSEDEK